MAKQQSQTKAEPAEPTEKGKAKGKGKKGKDGKGKDASATEEIAVVGNPGAQAPTARTLGPSSDVGTEPEPCSEGETEPYIKWRAGFDLGDRRRPEWGVHLEFS